MKTFDETTLMIKKFILSDEDSLDLPFAPLKEYIDLFEKYDKSMRFSGDMSTSDCDCTFQTIFKFLNTKLTFQGSWYLGEYTLYKEL